MVEDITVNVKLNVDEGSKQAVQNKAQAIRDTGSAPIQNEDTESFRGGIFGDTADPEVKGFEKRQSIGGGVKGFKDKSSKAAVDTKSEFQKIKDQQKILSEQNKFMQSQLNEFSNLISNPQGLLQNKILERIGNNPTGSEALKLIPLVGVALATPQILDQLFQLLIAPGGPWDRRLKIILAQQEEQFLSREAQKRREIGLDQVVISQTGFGNANGRLTVNTLNQVKQTGVSDIGLNEASIGMK